MDSQTRRWIGEAILALITSFAGQIILARPGDTWTTILPLTLIYWVITIGLFALISWTYKK